MAEPAFTPSFLRRVVELEKSASSAELELLDHTLASILADPFLPQCFPTFYDPNLPTYFLRSGPFLCAGTPVEDDSTAALMGSFYKNLRTMSKVEALRQAQLELIRGEGSGELLAKRGVGGIGKLGEVPQAKPASPSSLAVSTSHPYFWAPFILVGDGK